MNGKRATRWCAASAAALVIGIASTTAGADSPAGVPGLDDAAPIGVSTALADPVKPPDMQKQRQQEEQKRRAQEEARRRAQEEAKKRAQEEARRRAQEEARKRAAEEARRRAQDEARKRAAEEARRRAQEEAQKRAADQTRQRAQEQARERAAEQARQRAAEQARQRAQDEARQRAAQDAARQRAADLARQRAQEQARERAADLARQRAQQDARKRAADLARQRAQQDARERAADLARERAQQDARDRAADLARERAQQNARDRALEDARRRNSQESIRDARSVTPPARDLNNDRSRTREPIRVDPANAAALDRAVENARIRAEAQLRRERESTGESSSVIRITPRYNAERIDPVEPGEIRITPGNRDRFEVLREPENRSSTLSATNVAEAAKREAQREVIRGRESIDAGLTVPTRRYLDDNRGDDTGGFGNHANTNDFGNGNTSGSGANFQSPGGAQALSHRDQLPMQRFAQGGSGHFGGGSFDDHFDHFDDDFDHHHHDHHFDRHGHHNFRDFCDDFGHRRYRFYDRFGHSRSCSPWFSFHLFYGYRWRAYYNPYWYWWCEPGYSFRFYYDYSSPYYYRPWYTDVRYVTTYQTVYRTEVEYIEVPTPTLPAMTANEAWRLLAEGYYQEARSAFGRLSIDKPEDGTLRIGYAIAAGLEFDAGASVFALRRAIELDPISVRLVPVDAVLRRRVLDLIDHFAAESRRNEFDKDAYFMVAALNTVIGEDGLAFFAVDRALDLGDEEPSTYNLESIIRQRMEDRMGNGG